MSPIYTYKCPQCNKVKEIIHKNNDMIPPLCAHPRTYDDGYEDTYYQVMERVLSVPSPMQWGCKRF